MHSFNAPVGNVAYSETERIASSLSISDDLPYSEYGQCVPYDGDPDIPSCGNDDTTVLLQTVPVDEKNRMSMASDVPLMSDPHYIPRNVVRREARKDTKIKLLQRQLKEERQVSMN